ncbi:MAG: hypothetical protein R2697_00655 [Ilumatobacteraceae bacterium]
MGWFQMAMTGAPVLGLVVGGPLIEAFGWRSVFGVLFPMSLVGLTLAIRTSPTTATAAPVPIDVKGALTLATATLGFLLWLQFGGSDGLLTPLPLAPLRSVPVSLVAFVTIERRVEFHTAAPRLLPPAQLHRSADQPSAQPVRVHGQLPDLADHARRGVRRLHGRRRGLILLFRPAASSLTSPVGGKLTGRAGERPMLIVGTAAMVASMLTWVFAALWVDLWLVILGLVLSGLAMGLSSPSYQTAVANAVEPSDLGIANGMGRP